MYTDESGTKTHVLICYSNVAKKNRIGLTNVNAIGNVKESV